MLNPRLDLLSDYPFQRLRDLLAGTAPNPDLKPITMSIGEPQHAYPSLVAETLAANAHLYGKYPPANGPLELRQAAVDWLNRRYGLPAGMVDAERNVIALSGTREGLYMLASVAVPPEKRGKRPLVLMPNPFYQVYAGAAVTAGADPLYVPALPERNFLPDFHALPADVLARTALVYVCSPANPQGAVADLDYLERLIELAREHDFLLAIDECYAEIYSDRPPPGGLEACRRMGGNLSNVIVFHSLSKRSSVPGLRSGFCAGDPRAIAAFGKLRAYSSAPSPLPVSAAAAALWRDEAHAVANRLLYQEKFALAERILGNRFGFYKPAGGFFLWLDVGDGEAAARELHARAAITALPGLYLTRADAPDADRAGRPYLRVALVNDLGTTAEALARIADTLG